jgi:hypothetical protein
VSYTSSQLNFNRFSVVEINDILDLIPVAKQEPHAVYEQTLLRLSVLSEQGCDCAEALMQAKQELEQHRGAMYLKLRKTEDPANPLMADTAAKPTEKAIEAYITGGQVSTALQSRIDALTLARKVINQRSAVLRECLAYLRMLLSIAESPLDFEDTDDDKSDVHKVFSTED